MGGWLKLTESGPGQAKIYVNISAALSIRREADYTAITLPSHGGNRSNVLHVRELPEQILSVATERRE